MMPASQDHRQFERVTINVRVDAPASLRNRECHGQLRNVSLGGALILSDRSLPVNAPLEVKFHLPGVDETLAFPARVLRSTYHRDHTTLAVRFTGGTLQDQVRLGSFIYHWMEDHEPGRPHRAATPEEELELAAPPEVDLTPELEWAAWGVLIDEERKRAAGRKLAEEIGGGVIVVDARK